MWLWRWAQSSIIIYEQPPAPASAMHTRMNETRITDQVLSGCSIPGWRGQDYVPFICTESAVSSPYIFRFTFTGCFPIFFSPYSQRPLKAQISDLPIPKAHRLSARRVSHALSVSLTAALSNNQPVQEFLWTWTFYCIFDNSFYCSQSSLQLSKTCHYHQVAEGIYRRLGFNCVF